MNEEKNKNSEEQLDEHKDTEVTIDGIDFNEDTVLSEKNYKNQYLRLCAEFENFRKRTLKEQTNLVTMANQSLIKKILNVMDDMERALKNNTGNNDLAKGFKLIYDKFKSTLEKEGLKELNIKIGQEFDADKCEAVSKISTEKKLQGKIVDIIEKGYKLNKIIIRFAKVIIGE